MKWAHVVLVFVGGGLGSVCRYALATRLQRDHAGVFPVGTFTVNVLGCLAIGVVAAIGMERAGMSPEARAFVTIGLLGGFTTFSSFSYETLALFDAGGLLRAASYAAASLAAGLFGTWLGRALARLVA